MSMSQTCPPAPPDINLHQMLQGERQAADGRAPGLPEWWESNTGVIGPASGRLLHLTMGSWSEDEPWDAELASQPGAEFWGAVPPAPRHNVTLSFEAHARPSTLPRLLHRHDARGKLKHRRRREHRKCRSAGWAAPSPKPDDLVLSRSSQDKPLPTGSWVLQRVAWTYRCACNMCSCVTAAHRLFCCFEDVTVVVNPALLCNSKKQVTHASVRTLSFVTPV